jgi:sarcosine oxidase subunit gamma
MPERLSALVHLPSAGAADRFSLSEAGFRSILQVQAWPDTLKTVQAVIISELLNEDVPPLGSAILRRNAVVAAIAPGRFMLAGPDDLVARIEGALPASDAAVTDLSHGRVILTLEGDAAETALQGCVMIDLDRAAFPPGRVAQTMIHHVDVLIHRVGEKRFDLWVLRSFAQSLAEWIIDAGEGRGSG